MQPSAGQALYRLKPGRCTLLPQHLIESGSQQAYFTWLFLDMATQVDCMLRMDQLSQNQANRQQRNFVLISHGYVGLDASYARD